MKNRIELAALFRDSGYTRGAEIGVCDGRYSEILMETIPGLQLIGIDPYTAYDGYSDFRKQSTLDSKLAQARERLRKYQGYTLILSWSTEVSKLIADDSLDFVFIDGSHVYKHVLQDIKAWHPKVRRKGIVSGHDFHRFKSGRGGVIEAVNECVEEFGVSLQTTEWDMEAHPDDRQPDWFYVKE